ncbi:hypothetical protein HYY74_06840 [Candidatus Woesearchaeota archaeon]|nr:hypothetical protein [Candidatus Woesearchaeota archaeon]
MHAKKGQSAGGAASLIAAILGLMLLYILFLPPEAREELLGTNTTTGEVKGISEPSRILLLEKPGTVFRAKQDQFEHNLNAFNLYAKSEDRVMKSIGSVFVESKSGSTKKRTVAFSAEPGKTGNAQLSFQVKDHSGRLIVSLNDQEIFNGEASGAQLIGLDNLQDDNVLEFSAPETGFAFWQRNFYEMTDAKITATVSQTEGLEAKQTFIIGTEEINGLESANLLYFVYCRVTEAGSLRVFVNDGLVHSGVPDCGSPVKLPIDAGLLSRGVNTVRFSADSGSYLMDQVQVKTKLRQPIDPIYFFEVNDTQYAWINNNTFDTFLRMGFVDDGEEKRAELTINNRKLSMDTRRTANFTRNIDQYIVRGNNFIRIAPETTLNVIELRIQLE